MRQAKARRLAPKDQLERKFRVMWDIYRDAFPDESFTEFMQTAPLINDEDDWALCDAFRALPPEDQTNLAQRMDAWAAVTPAPSTFGILA